MLLGAKFYGVTEQVVDSVSGSIEGKKVRDIMDTLVVSQAMHSARKKTEMEFVMEVLGDAGVQPIMSTASRDSFEWISSLNLTSLIDPKKSKYSDVVAAILRRIEQGGATVDK